MMPTVLPELFSSATLDDYAHSALPQAPVRPHVERLGAMRRLSRTLVVRRLVRR